MPFRRILAALMLLACTSALAQQPADPASPPAERAAARFPQPVRVGDLLGKEVLRPVEAQNVLGRVAAIARRLDGAVLIVVRLGGVLGLGARPVAVPVEATALLGPYLAVMDLSPGQLRALPTYGGAGAQTLPADETIRVGLTRPFH